MGKWNSKEITEFAKRDFEKAWLETKALLPARKKYSEGKPPEGKYHVLFETIQRLRNAYLTLGFEEVVNPIFIEDKQIRRQFGPEAAAVLDRCYYIGGLPRPDVGLSDEKVKQMKKFGIELKNKEALQKVLHDYKKGEFGGDDLIYKLVDSLCVDDLTATRILNEVFSEFSALEPESTRITLRSHMTSGWFLTLEGLCGKRKMPLRLFSIDRCFRREQREDVSHLRAYHSASCVIMDEEVTVEDGKEVAKSLLSQFGFEKFEFKLDEKRSKYYAPDTQTEVYAYSPNLGCWVEIATFGMYSPVALSRYDIEYPVMNLGLGVERLAMVLHGYGDIRELAYPQFYKEFLLSDREIAAMIFYEQAPETREGKALAKKIIDVAMKNAAAQGPCEFLVYSGDFLGRKVNVKLVEVEKQKLLGPAALNEVYVYDGNIYGILKEKAEKKIVENGIATGIRYLDAFANLAARSIEDAVNEGKKEIVIKVKGVKMPSDINLKIEEPALRYITGNNKRIDVRGPVFTTVTAWFTH